MAEGWINHELNESWEACSAGTAPAEKMNPLAIRVMAEVGIDISKASPKLVDTYLGQPWDLVVTVCDAAKESCPIFPKPVASLHISFPDPAQAQGAEDERMAVFRRVRDVIRERLLPEVAHCA
jgi:arsenate reductase (thioredoxin)